MQKRKKIIIISLMALVVIGISCATPTQPTGGLADQTPPVVTRTEPENRTVNFDGDEIRFYFDKYVNRESFANALRIDPDIQLDYNIRWSGRSARVRFEQSLPDSTTLIFTIGTDLSDTNRNRIRQPVVLALSTGPAIDDGELEGRIRDGLTGRAKESELVVLYREPVDLNKRANYVAETDSSGRFRFTYLREGTYTAFWLNDRNRNRIWDRETEQARPFYMQKVEVRDRDTADIGFMYLTEPDTLRPLLQGIGMLSANRLRLRYSRSMRIEDDAEVTVVDSLGNIFTRAIPLYADPDDPAIIFAHAVEPVPDGETFTIKSRNITDEHGNLPESDSPDFEGSEVADTTVTRKIRHLTSAGVLDNEPHVFQFSTLLEGTTVVDSMQVIQDEIVYTAWEPVEVVDNLLFLYPPDQWQDGSDYIVRFYNELRGSRSDTRLEVFQRSRMGELEITIHEDFQADSLYHHVRVLDKDGYEVFQGKTLDTIIVEYLSAGYYTVIAFRDDNGTGRWYRGQVDPFSAPEPKVIERGVNIADRMTATLELFYYSVDSPKPAVEDLEPAQTEESTESPVEQE